MTDETKSEPIKTPPVIYSPNDAAIAEIREQVRRAIPDPVAAVATKDGYGEVKTALAMIVRLRTQIEERRKLLKADSLEYGRRIDGEAKRLTQLVVDIEVPLREAKLAKDREEERKIAEAEAKIKAEAEAKARAEREAEEARLKAERAEEERKIQAERERLAAERAEFDRQRKEAEDAARAERERVAEERRRQDELRALEQKKLDDAAAAIRAEQERLAKIEADRLAKERAEREAKEAEQKRQREAEERAEFERKAKEKAEREAAEKAAREAKEKADREERERLAAEAKAKADAEEAARIEAAKPDQDKIQLLGDRLNTWWVENRPETKTDAAGAWLQEMDQRIYELADELKAYRTPKRPKQKPL